MIKGLKIGELGIKMAPIGIGKSTWAMNQFMNKFQEYERKRIKEKRIKKLKKLIDEE